MISACASGNHHPPKLDLFSLPCTRSNLPTLPATPRSCQVGSRPRQRSRPANPRWRRQSAQVRKRPRVKTPTHATCAHCRRLRHTSPPIQSAHTSLHVAARFTAALSPTPRIVCAAPFRVWRTESTDTCEPRFSQTRPQGGFTLGKARWMRPRQKRTRSIPEQVFVPSLPVRRRALPSQKTKMKNGVTNIRSIVREQGTPPARVPPLFRTMLPYITGAGSTGSAVTKPASVIARGLGEITRGR